MDPSNGLTRRDKDLEILKYTRQGILERRKTQYQVLVLYAAVVSACATIAIQGVVREREQHFAGGPVGAEGGSEKSGGDSGTSMERAAGAVTPASQAAGHRQTDHQAAGYHPSTV